MVEYEGIFIRYDPDTGQYILYDNICAGKIAHVYLVEGPGYIVSIRLNGMDWSEVASIANLLADLNETIE